MSGIVTPATFRRATLHDLDAVIRLLGDDDLGRSRERPDDPAARPAYVTAFAAIDADANQLLVVAEVDGVVAGCLQLTFIPGLTLAGTWRAQIEGVRISSSARGAGVGTEMLHWAIDRARERGCGLVQLTTDKRRSDAHRFYASLGFVGSHEGMKLKL